MKPAAALIFGFGLMPLPARAADQAAPVILSPSQGAIVSSPVTITLKPGDMDSAMPNMPGMTHGGHLHLVVDAKLPTPGAPIPMDAHHIHLVHGETSKTLSLPPGKHTIQLIRGGAGHTVPTDAPHSDPVTFEVR